jgi:hypothetical protein
MNYYFAKRKRLVTQEQGDLISQTEQTVIFRGHRTNVTGSRVRVWRFKVCNRGSLGLFSRPT